LKEKATGREAATRQALESVGGKLEAMYWIISGEYTGIGIWEFPDAATGAALSASTAPYRPFKMQTQIISGFGGVYFFGRLHVLHRSESTH
jgi:uncharacterized protein with GYD domain